MDQSHQHFDALLAGYVAGTLAEPARLLVRSHLDLSPVNRGFVRDLEAAGGTMLEEIAPARIDNRDAMLAAIFASPAEDPISVPQMAVRTRLPLPLAGRLPVLLDGRRLQAFQWFVLARKCGCWG